MTEKKPRTDDELKQIARDIHKGLIFTDRQIPMPKDGPDDGWYRDAQMVFMPLSFMNEKQREAFVADKPQMLYEYLDKAGPRSINGLPMFMSMSYISGEEWPRMQAYLKVLFEAPDPLESVTVPEK